jgi:hypothetical protein
MTKTSVIGRLAGACVYAHDIGGRIRWRGLGGWRWRDEKGARRMCLGRSHDRAVSLDDRIDARIDVRRGRLGLRCHDATKALVVVVTDAGRHVAYRACSGVDGNAQVDAAGRRAFASCAFDLLARVDANRIGGARGGCGDESTGHAKEHDDHRPSGERGLPRRTGRATTHATTPSALVLGWASKPRPKSWDGRRCRNACLVHHAS